MVYNMPKVSIVVPVYKVEKYLDRCIQSLLNQTMKDIEIILVDDGSPDNCPAMCDDYSKKDSRVKVIHKQNAGLGMACNSGIEAAQGEYIAFCDSDDWVDLDCYETLYKCAKTNGVDAVYSGIKRVDEHGTVIPMHTFSKETIYKGEDLCSFQLGMIASSPEKKSERERQMSAKIVLYSLDIINKYDVRFKSEREYISEDLIFNLDFLQHCKSVMEIPYNFYNYYVNYSSLTKTLRKDRFDKYKFLREYLLSHYEFKDNIESHNRINKMFIGYMRNAIEQIIDSSESIIEKQRLLNMICKDNIWSLISEKYPIKTLSYPKYLIFQLTKYRMIFGLYLIFKLKNL